MNREEIAGELAKPLAQSRVKSRSQAGQTLSYIEGWDALSEANRIFGWDGWTRETLEMREVRAEIVGDKHRVAFIAKVRVTVGGIFRDGTGYGSGIAKDLGDAYESAAKEAETDATKRALMTFGNPFGLALYDKTRANVEDDTKPKREPSRVAISADSRAVSGFQIEAARTQIQTAPDLATLKVVWAGLYRDHPAIATAVEGDKEKRKAEILAIPDGTPFGLPNEPDLEPVYD